MLTAARYASSAMNKQPLQYVVVKTPQKVKEVFSYTKWAGSLPPEQGQPKAGEEPVLFVGIVENMDLASAYTDTDAGLAISNLTLAAWNHGIGSCIIGACNKQKLGELFASAKTRNSIPSWRSGIRPIPAGSSMQKGTTRSISLTQIGIMSFRNVKRKTS